ncbi:hypothetical protein SBC1_72160 (plasmid) [Caballeronia sp. SBC1]|uniref:hypothetical protein n=1 Tax=unclassified Caballeronia TaxID=2646786 RepID=UPI0013E1D974|nr:MULTISPECIES: hypothetical protein [unclassified Caballeronia]QIE29406.1 hypothetical protein SBC2_74820 [Caballeronia sp. SBC2]QIN67169.1 hypothetical protein SBC1_72160 [Caballeronia sp. SBC1]
MPIVVVSVQVGERAIPGAGVTDRFFDYQAAALPFLRARSSVEMLTPDCSAAS